MGTLVFYTIVFVTLYFMIFFHDIFPYCLCCKRIKPRALFKIHKVVKIRFGYEASRSVCRKCCKKYDIMNLDDYKKVEMIKKKSERLFQARLR